MYHPSVLDPSRNPPKPPARREPKKGSNQPLSIYFAGDLWNHKDLIGNAILAEHIEKHSHGRYRCVVPQNLEQATKRAVGIRNQDLKQVMVCDVCLFNFDGTELDSGTVVEFMYAKMLDIPCVILRTDFRSSGDGNKDGDPWNLMVSNWPRARILLLHGMSEYQAAVNATHNLEGAIHNLYTKMAGEVVENLDAVRIEPLIVDPARIEEIYQWAKLLPGGGFADLFAAGELEELIAAKHAKGLL